jgi:signal transduction histidine kinase/putative methionine-R-sulfoxide reductase with GAF domain
MPESVGGQQARRLCDFLRGHQAHIIEDWSQRVRSLSPARELSQSVIIDHLPQILRRIADRVESTHPGQSVSLGDLSKVHAVDRLGRGFDLDQIVAEYGLLRRCILDLWESRVGPSIDLAELRNLDGAFDESISESTLRIAEARGKLLKALDRVSEAALGSTDLDSFLQDLLQATREGTESVDTCCVLLREGDTLRVRAAVGLDEELRRGYSIAMHEGFAGHVAAEGHPVELRHAAADPVVTSPAICRKGIRALYGVPMTRDGKVIGVAHIGSLRADEFSAEDKLLFRTVVSRATAGVVKAQILADLRRTESAQRFLSEASKRLAESLDYETTLAHVARLAVPTIADWCVVDLVDGASIRRVSAAHSDPAKQQLALELAKRYPLDANAASGVPNVVRTGVSEWAPEIADGELAAVARGAEHLRMLRELGLKSYIVVPIRLNGSAAGAITLVTAESRRRYSHADLHLAEDLGRRVGAAIENARLYAAAQDAIGVRERVLAVVSHDLRNQLGVVAMAAELVARRAPSSRGAQELQKPVETILRTTGAMQHLLGDLLDMASIEAGRLSVEQQPLEIEPILEEACETHEAIARAKGLRLRAEFDVGRVTVLADRKRILQVLGNLLANAIKFSESGSVTLSATAQDTDVVIAVTDTGPGIPQAERDAIFEPYRTIQREREGPRGSGLGLHIAKGIVTRHNGRMWVDSEVGRGSTFFFTLPRA